MRVRAVVACVVALLGPGPVAEAGAAVPLALAGRVTVTAPAGAGQLLVRVPRSVVLPGACNDSKAVDVRGSAAFAAVVLAPRPYRPGVPNVILGRLPDGRRFDTVCRMDQRLLTAGTYTLTVVHTPGTAGFTLTLPGLPGSLSISRLRGVRASAAVLPAFATPADVSRSARGWGAEGELIGQGMVATVAWLTGTIEATVFGDCVYAPGAHDAVPRALRYAPGCPTGDSATAWAVRTNDVFFAGSTLGVPPGTYGIGAWYAAPAGSVVRGGAVGLWVPFG